MPLLSTFYINFYFHKATVKQLSKSFEGKDGASEEKGSYEELTIADGILY